MSAVIAAQETINLNLRAVRARLGSSSLSHMESEMECKPALIALSSCGNMPDKS